MPRDEIGVARHPRDFALVEQWNRLHEFSQVVVADLVGERVIAFGIDPLADQHLQPADLGEQFRSEEHTSELQSLMRISYDVFCLKKKKQSTNPIHRTVFLISHISTITYNKHRQQM